eukprot:scaffold1439_cov404-Prasinococcus_capsulatus_cf.AAC.5
MDACVQLRGPPASPETCDGAGGARRCGREPEDRCCSQEGGTARDGAADPRRTRGGRGAADGRRGCAQRRRRRTGGGGAGCGRDGRGARWRRRRGGRRRTSARAAAALRGGTRVTARALVGPVPVAASGATVSPRCGSLHPFVGWGRPVGNCATL